MTGVFLVAQSQPIQQNFSPNPNPNPSPSPYLRSSTTTGVLTAGASIVGGGGAGPTCQDCGNQAKKDCGHRRCRTCCKSRGFDCSTHVRSTWIPASRRRDRHPCSSACGPPSKKPRATGATSSTSNSASSGHHRHQDAEFKERLPGQVRAPAVFKCVRVTSIDEDGEDGYAYQTKVKISGHVFKGFLYDHGIVDSSSSSSIDAVAGMSELHLGGGAGGGGRNMPTDLSGLLGGTANYGHPMN